MAFQTTGLKGRSGLPAISEPFASAWRHRELIVRLAGRDLVAGYRGALLGWLWLLVVPLGTLAIFSVSMTSIPGAAAAAGMGDRAGYVLFVFCGLIFFQMFADVMIRAPHVLRENISFIKKVIFPVEILAWVALSRSLLVAGISMLLLVILVIAVRGPPSLAIGLLPLIFVSFCLMVMGVIWLLSVIGVYLRDMTYLTASLMPAFMFLTPLFYPLDGFPRAIRPFAYVNPLTPYIEITRAILIQGTVPWGMLLVAVALGVGLFCLGYKFFDSNRHRTIDAL